MPGRVAEADTPRRSAFSRRPGAMRMLRRKRKGIAYASVPRVASIASSTRSQCRVSGRSAHQRRAASMRWAFVIDRS